MKKLLFLFLGFYLIVSLHFVQTEVGAKSEVRYTKPLLSILFVGDTSWGENYQERLEKKGEINILKEKGYDYSIKKLTSILKSSNVTIANLETPLTTLRTSPWQEKKRYLHWGDPERVAEMLQKYHIKSVSLANNHTLDYGQLGLQQTINALQSRQIKWFGAGFNARKAAASYKQKFLFDNHTLDLEVIGGFWYDESYDQKYNFYAKANSSGTNLWTKSTAREQIKALRENNPCAFIVAFPHWGLNYHWKTINQVELAHSMVDAGVDLVIGHGAHMAQEIENYQNRWILYSLGNFVFNSPGRYLKKKDAHPYSLTARLDITQENEFLNLTLRLYPIFSNNRLTNYQPRPVNRQEFNELLLEIFRHNKFPRKLRQQISLGKDGIGYYFHLDLGLLKSETEPNNLNLNPKNEKKDSSNIGKNFCKFN